MTEHNHEDDLKPSMLDAPWMAIYFYFILMLVLVVVVAL